MGFFPFLGFFKFSFAAPLPLSLPGSRPEAARKVKLKNKQKEADAGRECCISSSGQRRIFLSFQYVSAYGQGTGKNFRVPRSNQARFNHKCTQFSTFFRVNTGKTPRIPTLFKLRAHQRWKISLSAFL